MAVQVQADVAQPPPANPGASSSVVVYDTGNPSLDDINASRGVRRQRRCRVAVYTNVTDLKLRVEWYAPGSTNARLVQADVTIGAATYFQRSIRLQPSGRTVVSLITTTNPTTWEVGVDLTDDQALDQ